MGLPALTEDFQQWYATAQDEFYKLISKLEVKGQTVMTLTEIEVMIREGLQGIGRSLTEAKMKEIGRQRAAERVTGSDGVERSPKRLMPRKAETIFGEIEYQRWGYGSPGAETLFPADGHLNLPAEKFSHEVRRLVSEDVTRASYDESLEVLSERTAAKVAKRQGLELTRRAANDFVEFYEESAGVVADVDGGVEIAEDKSGSLLVLTTDGKGVAMRPEGLREATRKAASGKKHKLGKRLSRGEKSNRKRMAQVASVYTISPHRRTAEEIAGSQATEDRERESAPAPRPENKRVWASVAREPEEVIGEMFADATRRDPLHQKQWVALLDGQPHQLRLVRAKAQELGVELTIVLDIIHVLEYLWKAAWALFGEGHKDAEAFVTERLLRLLRGQSSQVAKGIRRMATERNLKGKTRKQVDISADYLLKYRECLRYDRCLEQGFPIATGIIEGACRYLVKDRMDITGARWGLEGAEAVLKLRSLRASGDFKEYWRYHEEKERQRNHISKYADGLPPLCSGDDGVKPPMVKAHLRLLPSAKKK
jgi:hypothetical protein